jgi:hypothetical protein
VRVRDHARSVGRDDRLAGLCEASPVPGITACGRSPDLDIGIGAG